ncbi:MAG: ribonuclease III family protein, partial [Acidimicrobiales bacterium]
MTHRSWCAEHPGDPSNERLEFLGDAVLGLVVTDYLFSRFPDLPEGQLAKARAAVVSADALAAAGIDLGIGPDLRLGKGED